MGFLKIIIDDKIPYIKGALESFAEVIYLPGAVTTSEIVKDADALITRTRTICNRQLLEGSNVKYIATATIGFDHIDREYCQKTDIQWVNAPGCNAESVNQYMASALISYTEKKRIHLSDKTIGIVGVGQVGSRVERLCRTLGMKVLLNDPPRERREGSEGFVPFETIIEEADIITFHVPLNMEGPDATFHMVNELFLNNLKKKPLLINTCRGEVFDTPSVVNARKERFISGLIVDCWENEPNINLDLLKISDFATPHIAGYSKDGKANGTKNSVREISRFFDLGIDDWEPLDVDPPPNPEFSIAGKNKSEFKILSEAILGTYQIEKDDNALRKNPENFETLRGDYPVRREFDSHTIIGENITTNTIEKLTKLGFKFKTK